MVEGSVQAVIFAHSSSAFSRVKTSGARMHTRVSLTRVWSIRFGTAVRQMVRAKVETPRQDVHHRHLVLEPMMSMISILLGCIVRFAVTTYWPYYLAT